MKHVLFSIFCTALFWSGTLSAESIMPKGKPFPEVTFDRVSKIFGHNLDTDDGRLKTLLLAIGMDHTTPSSPHTEQKVGIPFIVHYGPDYWVERLTGGETSVDVLVNNALLLLFAEAEIPNREQAAFDLMERAADSGYWPAAYFVAETNLLTHLVREPEISTPTSLQIDHSGQERLAQETMAAYNRCAEIGFAPCQFRIGFWLINSPENLSDGLRVLQVAIDTSLKDTRYDGVLDNVVANAANQVVTQGGVIGLDSAAISQYQALIHR